jgi:hypothetical protein
MLLRDVCYALNVSLAVYPYDHQVVVEEFLKEGEISGVADCCRNNREVRDHAWSGQPPSSTVQIISVEQATIR